MAPRTPVISHAEIIEQCCVPRVAGSLGDDVISLVFDAEPALRFAAVIDGVTARHSSMINGVSAGRWAATTVADALRCLDPELAPREAVDHVSAYLDAQLIAAVASGAADASLLHEGRPACVAVVLNLVRGELWRVGDCQALLVAGDSTHLWAGGHAIDEVTTAARATYLRCLLAAGADPDELAATDPGRALILPLLRAQQQLANSDDPMGFGVLNGTDVPGRYVEVMPVGTQVDQVVLASDGYLELCPTLAQSEASLFADIAADPLRIGRHPGTKAVPSTGESFDDRTYLRVAVASPPASTTRAAVSAADGSERGPLPAGSHRPR